MMTRSAFLRTGGLLAAILVLVVLTGRSGTAQGPHELTGRFVTIDAPGYEPGEAWTFARGITADGRVTGWYVTDTGARGFVLAGETFTTIDVPFAEALAERTSAQGINARGDIVGIWLQGGVPAFQQARGYLLEAYGGFSVIQVPGANATRPRSINASGEIVGWFTFPGTGARGFLRDRSGEYFSIAVPGALHTHAHSINDRGHIVGRYFDGPPSNPGLNVDAFWAGISHGFLRTAAGFTPLDVPFPGATSTSAYGINASGDIVGCYTAMDGRLLTFVRDRHGRYWSFEAPTELPAPFTCAVAINASGDIAGSYTDGNGDVHGFVLQQPR